MNKDTAQQDTLQYRRLYLDGMENFAAVLSKFFNVYQYGVTHNLQWNFIVEGLVEDDPVVIDIDPFDIKNKDHLETVLTSIGTAIANQKIMVLKGRESPIQYKDVTPTLIEESIDLSEPPTNTGEYEKVTLGDLIEEGIKKTTS